VRSVSVPPAAGPLLRTALAIILLSIALPAGRVSGEAITTEHFEVSYGDVGKWYAELAAGAAEKSYSLVSGMLSHEPGERIRIVLTHSEREFREMTRGVLPDWSAAAALPGNRIVVSPLSGHKLDLEHIIAHEIVHCFINDAAGEEFVPRWFHEGCAEVISGRWGVRGRAYMVWAVVRGRLLTFSDIQRIFSARSADAALAYDQSMLAVSHLMARYGRGVLGDILAGMKDGLPFDVSFRRATGTEPGDFETLYLAYLKRNYGRRALVTLVPGTWTAILLLAFVVYAVKKYRTRRLLKQWEESERAGDIIDFPPFPPDEYD